MTIFGEKIVIAMASSLADPDDIEGSFRDELHKAFPKSKRKFTNKDEEVGKYLREWIQAPNQPMRVVD